MKKKYLILLTFLMLLCSPALKAQENPDAKKIRLKLYANGFYSYARGPDDFARPWENAEALFRKENFDFGHLSFAVEIDGGKFFSHELELMPFWIERNKEIHYINFLDTLPSPDDSRVTSGGTSTSIEIAFRYQANHYFCPNKIFDPYFGLSSQLYYTFSEYVPYTSMTFPAREQDLGLLFSLVPGVLIHLNEKMALDFNIPLGIYDFRLNMTKEDNPLLPVRNRKNSKFIGEFIPNYVNFRIGLIYTL